MSDKDLGIIDEIGSIDGSIVDANSSDVGETKTLQDVLPNNQNDLTSNNKNLVDKNIFKKIVDLLLMSFLVGLGFSAIVGPIFSLCACLFSRRRYALFSGFVCGVMAGYLIGIVVGSIWFLLKEFKK